MRRWLIVFALLVLPLQMVWAAAASYCAHESAEAAQHFGHHQHKHTGGDRSQQSGQAEQNELLKSNHVDCEACHLGGPMTPSVGRTMLIANGPQAPPINLDARYVSRTVDGLERPQRRNFTLAVRFGSGDASAF